MGEAVRRDPGEEGPRGRAAGRRGTGHDGLDLARLGGTGRLVEASLLEDDLQARLKLSTGDGLVDPAKMARRGAEWLARAKGYAETLRDYTLEDYAEQRLMWLQGVLGLLGVRLQKGTAYFERFLAACLAAEIRSTDQMILRETKRQGFGLTHPDAVQGPWRRAAPAYAETLAVPIIVPSNAAPAVAAQPASGHTLADCLVKWKERRVVEKKPIDPHLTSDMENTFARFFEYAKIDDIGLITRKMVVNFRDDFAKQENYTAGTINKKIGYILNMSKVAAGAGWIDQDLGRGYYLNAAGDEDQREPYTGEQLKTIFGHKLFTDGWRPKSVKALGEFGFWFPLISATHGMITSEVLQLGPDTVGPHPEAKDVMVFTVTTAGGRKVKALARKRAVPIRQELRTSRTDGRSIVAAEVGDGLEVRHQAAGQPHQLEVALGLSFEPAAGGDAVEVAVDVDLEQGGKMIGGPARRLRQSRGLPDPVHRQKLRRCAQDCRAPHSRPGNQEAGWPAGGLPLQRNASSCPPLISTSLADKGASTQPGPGAVLPRRGELV